MQSTYNKLFSSKLLCIEYITAAMILKLAITIQHACICIHPCSEQIKHAPCSKKNKKFYCLVKSLLKKDILKQDLCQG